MTPEAAHALDALFHPDSIAVIGASGNPAKIGGRPIAFLKRFRFAGPIYPVNPNAAEIQGLPAYPTVAAIGRPVDMVVVAVPAPMVLDALRDAASAGVKAAVVFSSGFAEVGKAGADMQADIAALARKTGLRVLGPNCLGVMSGDSGVYATFTPVIDQGLALRGKIGLVSQSGAFGAFAYAMARQRGLGISHWVTTGNESDIDLAACLDWLVDDASTRVVLAYMEGCRDGPALVRALEKARAARKPVIIVKVGRTDLGAKAAAAHTAASAGADPIYAAIFRQFGVHRAMTIEEGLDVAYAASVAGLPRGRTLGMLTVSGGAGVLMADAAGLSGLEAPPMPQAAQDQILARISFASARNPVDVTGQVGSDPELTPLAYRLMLGDANYDSLVVFLSASGLSAGGPTAVRLAVEMRQRFPDRVIALCSLFREELQRQLDDAGILTFADPGRAVSVVGALAQLATAMASPRMVASPPRPTSPVSRVDDKRTALEVLAAAGFTMVGSRTGVEARIEADLLDDLVVAAKIADGVECVISVARDAVFGPMVKLGLGGAASKAVDGAVYRLAPFDLEEAHRMIDELRARIALDEWGGHAPDVNVLAQALVDVSHIAAAGDGPGEFSALRPFIDLPHEGRLGSSGPRTSAAKALERRGRTAEPERGFIWRVGWMGAANSVTEWEYRS